MTFQNRRLHPLFLSLLLSLAVCGCRLQLEPPKPEPSPAPAPSPVEPQPPRPDPPQPTPPQPGGDVRESEFYSALSRAVLDGEFADTDHLFAFSRYYREKHNIPPGGDVVNREFWFLSVLKGLVGVEQTSQHHPRDRFDAEARHQ